MSLKCFQRLGCFPAQDEVPEVVIDHLRRGLGLSSATKLVLGSERTARAQRELVREQVGVVFDPERAQTVVVQAIRAAAEVKNNLPDLINGALELLVMDSVELSGFSRSCPGALEFEWWSSASSTP